MRSLVTRVVLFVAISDDESIIISKGDDRWYGWVGMQSCAKDRKRPGLFPGQRDGSRTAAVNRKEEHASGARHT